MRTEMSSFNDAAIERAAAYRYELEGRPWAGCPTDEREDWRNEIRGIISVLNAEA